MVAEVNEMHNELQRTLMFDSVQNGRPLLREVDAGAAADAGLWITCTALCLDIVSPDGTVGRCEINRVPELRCGWLSYFVHPPYRGRRFATAAVEVSIEAASRMGLVRVKAHVSTTNEASMRVLLHNGFQPWHRLRRPSDDRPVTWARWI